MLQPSALEDWLLTGEGQVDGQSQHGKLLSRIGRLALETLTPAIAFVGAVIGDEHELGLPGIGHIFPIVPGPCSLVEAMGTAQHYLYAAVLRVMKLALHSGSRKGEGSHERVHT